MQLIVTLIVIACAGYGIFWIGSTQPEVKEKIEKYFLKTEFHTLELHYTANQIMQTYRKDLLKDAKYRYLEPVLKFYPYLLLEVKYILSEEKTKEGVILWDLTDGEMVIDTKTWEKTHGFGDCINASASRQEFRILNILAKKGGSSDREGLTKILLVENEILDSWLDSCRKKKLIVQSGNRYRLHLQNPKFRAIPETKIEERLVTKPFKGAFCVSKQYSFSQIENIAKAAFGNDFVIRRTADIYLPVHEVTVENPDGSIHTSHWNALNGKPLSQSSFIE